MTHNYVFYRRLRIEQLEDRRLLAGVTVGNNYDVVNGSITSIAALIANNGGDGISLREAVLAANVTSGADTVEFATGLSGGTILLTNGDLVITESLTIDASPLSANVIINANQLSRLFNITAATGDFTFGGLTLTGGRTAGNNSGFSDRTFNGGAIRSVASGNLTLAESILSDNRTVGFSADGGGIYAVGNVTLIQSTVSGNSTAGSDANGGGILANGNVTVTQSTVSGNSIAGSFAYGGGGGGICAGGSVTLTQTIVSGNSTAGYQGGGGGILAHGNVTLSQSTISGNSVAGSFAYGGGGGGIFTYGTVTLNQSTVSDNSTAGVSAFGGGIFSHSDVNLSQSTVSDNSTTNNYGSGGGIRAFGEVTLIQSTVSGNSTAGLQAAGGGIVADSVTLTQSTVTGNIALHASAKGGGVYQTSGYNYPISINGSIVAGNSAGGGNPDLKLGTGTLMVSYSLIGNTSGTMIDGSTGVGNILNVSPLVGPLADNGGLSKTHALLAGSPAIDAGDPAAVAGVGTVPLYDERGASYVRVLDGNGNGSPRIDMGAYERVIPDPPGDYNRNRTVDASDYVLWRKTLGSNVSRYFGADGDGNGVVQSSDYAPWRANFGATPSGTGGPLEGGEPGAGTGTFVEQGTLLAETPRIDPLRSATAPDPIIAPAKSVATLLDVIAAGNAFVGDITKAQFQGPPSPIAPLAEASYDAPRQTSRSTHIRAVAQPAASEAFRDHALMAWYGQRGNGLKQEVVESFKAAHNQDVVNETDSAFDEFCVDRHVFNALSSSLVD